MKSNWKEIRLGDVAEIKGGKRLPKGKQLSSIPNNHPYIKVKNMGQQKVLQLNSEYEYVDDETQKSISRYIVSAGDILISVVGTVGLVSIVGETLNNANQTENCDKITNLREIDADYLYYYLISPLGQEEIHKGTVGAVQAKLPLKNIQDFSIICPDLIEQKRVASVLSIIDEKIACNKRINDNLLQQAQLLYKDRFVDMTPFDRVMPADWHEGTVSEIIELHDSQRIPLSSRERADLAKIYPYYGATSIMDYVDRYLFDGIYLLLGEDGTVVDAKGFPILQYVEGKFWVNNHAHIITGKNGFSVELLYLLFSMTNVQSIVTGAVQPKISQANLNKVPVVIPSIAELQAFDSVIQPIFAQIRSLRAENDRLAAIRDTLLPKLMSGELDVSNIAI